MAGLTDARIEELGDELYEALRAQRTVPPLTSRVPSISIEEAYFVSRRLVDRRLADGETIVGKKIGVTSPAVQNMLGVYRPDFGFLTDRMIVADGGTVPMASMIQPRAEAEIAFRLRRDLVGPGVDEDAVLAATETVMPCFEIVDSRIKDWKIKIEDTIADNASCGVYVLGDAAVDPRELDLPEVTVRVYKNGSLVSEGRGSAVQGNPLTAVAWLANTLGEFGIPLRSGELILSGSLVPLEPVVRGDRMNLEMEGVGTASVSFG